MKLYSQLFIAVIVATCQANHLRINPTLLSRQGVSNEPNDRSYELDPKTLLIPDAYKPGHLRAWDDPSSTYATYHTPVVHSRINPDVTTSPEVEDSEEEEELNKIDQEALSVISEESRQFLLSKLSKKDRKALLDKIKDVHLADVFPINENRFGFAPPRGGFAGAAAQIGASAGGYIGAKLAGEIGAKLGAAAGAYLGAAAAARLESSLHVFGSSKNSGSTSSVASGSTKIKYSNPSQAGVQYGYGGGASYGAVVVKNK